MRRVGPFQVERVLAPSGSWVLTVSVLAVLAALTAAAAIFWSFGINPLRAYALVLAGTLADPRAAPEILRYCVEKGSIAVDGVSLTIAGLSTDSFSIALVPHTLETTTLGRLEPGDPVNLEVDVLAKYVERLLVR